MTALGDYQFDVGGGLVIGSGTLLPVGEVTGLGVPDLRTADMDNPTDDGGFPGVDLFGTRTMTIEAGIRTPDDPGAALDLLARLQQVTGADAVRKTAGALAVQRVKWPGRDVKRLYASGDGVAPWALDPANADRLEVDLSLRDGRTQ